jgi:ABC-type uncharacterized transport system fused permease/ATPase subunit
MQSALHEVALSAARSHSIRVEGDEQTMDSAPNGRRVFEKVSDPKVSRRKRMARVLGWRFSDIYHLWRVAHRGGCSEDCLFLLVCFANVIAQVISLSLPVYSGQIVGELTGANTQGEAADGAKLARNISQAVGIIIVYILLSCSASLVLMLMGIRWRGALTRELQRMYLLAGRSLAFYKVQLFDCDNPDQRIAADAANFTKLCCGGVAPPLSSVISQLIQNLSLAIAATFVSVKRAGWRITLITYAYNLITIALNVLVSIPIAASTAAQGAREGDFRRSHLRLQTYAESIALYGAQESEHEQLDAKLQPVLDNQRKLTLEYFRLIVTLTFTQVGGGLIGLMIAAVSVWSGERRVYGIQELSEVLGTLDLLTSALQALPGLLPEITTIAGLSKRVIELHRVLDALNQAPPPPVEPVDTPDMLRCERLSYSIPDGSRKLAQALSFTVRDGASVLVVGESGCGKSSLLRCIAGLWDADSGAIYRPLGPACASGVFFVPQKPYMCVGSLRAQIRFPHALREDDAMAREGDERMLALLEELALGDVVRQFGLDGVEAWEDVLSIGEQQRVSFARLLYHRAKFAIMDEATSALDLEIEARCLQLLKDAGMVLLSVAHRPSVACFHDFKLRLRRDGTHDLTPIVDGGL